MKVLHLLGADEDSGGILSVLRNLQSAAEDHGLKHAVLVHRRYREVRAPALTYHYNRWILQESPSHAGLLGRSAIGYLGVRRAMRAGGFDLAHAHSRGTLLVALALGSTTRWPALYTNHAFARRKGLYRWAARRRHLWSSVLTPNMARHYGMSTQGQGGVSVVSECCAERFFEIPPVEPRPIVADRPIRLVGLGNIVRWKNWHVLLEALAHLPENVRSRFVFDHWGPVPRDAACQEYRAVLAELARRAAPAQCHFHGQSLNVEEPLRQADWFVLPSTHEPCSVALIEALAMGLPVIVSRSGGNVDIVEADRTGVLFADLDSRDLARQLQRIVGGEIQPLAPGSIRESVRGRSATAVSAEYLALYRRMLGRVAG
jgi:glycosyltransferase involved in cell wall biosynthesis